MSLSRRERYEKRLAVLRSERSQSWEGPWKLITEQLVPYRVVWPDARERNRGDRKDSKIINSTPVQALRTLAAGMMAGITSPARKWFDLTTEDPELADVKNVRAWLDQCQSIIEAVLQSSNWYTALSNGTYLDLGSIGTAAMFHEESDVMPGTVSFRPLPIGEYYLDVDHEGKVDVCFRELHLTVRQVVGKFGLDVCSQQTRDAYDRGELNNGVDVCHSIMPNDEYEYGAFGRHGMRFASCWWEKTEPRKEAFLRESGYEEFPILAPRWAVRPSDVYGRGPGWDALGDCKALQLLERRNAEMVDKITNPPMRSSGTIKRASLLPGDRTEIEKGSGGVFEPAHEVPPAALTVLREEKREIEDRIREAMYSDLWRRIIDDDRPQRATATEIQEAKQEKMLMLGPLLENLDNGLLEPAIERQFAICERNGMFPPPPEELEGQRVKAKFISIMHQMQQTTELGALRVLVGETLNMSQAMPEVLDKLDGDAIVEHLQSITGAPARAVRSKEDVDEMRRVRAEQEMAKQTGEAMLAATEGARNLSSGDPAKISEVAGMLSPVAAAQGGALGTSRAA